MKHKRTGPEWFGYYILGPMLGAAAVLLLLWAIVAAVTGIAGLL